MLIGAVAEVFLGINAEQKSLEDIAMPLGLVEGGPSPRLSTVTGTPRSPSARSVLDAPGVAGRPNQMTAPHRWPWHSEE
jgi:hypothetical protein